MVEVEEEYQIVQEVEVEYQIVQEVEAVDDSWMDMILAEVPDFSHPRMIWTFVC